MIYFLWTMNRLSPDISRRIDRFVYRLKENLRPLAIEYIAIENIQESEPEIMSLFMRYGQNLRYISDHIEDFRRKVDLPFETLRTELRKRLYH